MHIQAIVAFLLSLVLTACAAYGGATLLDVRTEVNAPHSVDIEAPDAIQTSSGTRFHGWICRRSPVFLPTRLRLERIGANGEVLASASRAISGLTPRGSTCTIYDVPTDWRVNADERVRICAQPTDTSCPVPGQAGVGGD